MPAPAKIDFEQVVALRAAEHGIRAIARALGVAPSSISRILRRPDIAERVERERERLAGGALGDHPPEKESSSASSAAVWLLVRSGSWGFGSRRGEKVVMRSFPAGLYLDVDEEVVGFARKENNPRVVLGTGEPPASE